MGRYVVVDRDGLAPLVPLATKVVGLDEFVDLAGIDPAHFETSAMWRRAGNQTPCVLLARALRRTGNVASARFVVRSRQYSAALRSVDGRLVMSTLAFRDESFRPARSTGSTTSTCPRVRWTWPRCSSRR